MMMNEEKQLVDVSKQPVDVSKQPIVFLVDVLVFSFCYFCCLILMYSKQLSCLSLLFVYL